MAPPTSTGQPPRPATTKAEATDRPATVKQEDIQSMDDDVDDGGGWAGAQEEVDYSAKLKFDESDEEQETPSKSSEGKAKSSSSNNVGYSEDRSADGKSQSRKVRLFFKIMSVVPGCKTNGYFVFLLVCQYVWCRDGCA